MTHAQHLVRMSELCRWIHDAPCKMVIAVTGGGVCALHDLLTTPGASRTILEAKIPYSSKSLDELLGLKPDQYCSQATARAMAMACYERAIALGGDESPPEKNFIGVACTASLASDREKRGEHRAYMAVQTSWSTHCSSMSLEKGRRTRLEEDAVVSRFLLRLICPYRPGEDFPPIDLPPEVDAPTADLTYVNATKNWQKLFTGEVGWANSEVDCGEKLAGSTTSPLAIYSGAFHPRHQGHRQIARLGAKRFGQVIHEISIRNVDKPSLDFIEMKTRAAQFSADEQLVFTRCPTFAEKSRVFPGATFLVGVDTIERISEPRYYGDAAARDAAIAELASQQCRFLVFGRLVRGQFHEFNPATVTPALAELCDWVSEDEFRVDISSSAIRASNSDH